MVTLKAKKEAERLSVEILELAVSCKLISTKQEKQLLQEILAHFEKHKDKIKEKEQKIQEFFSQKDYLKLLAKKENIDTQLMIKVENKMAEHIVLKGNDASLVVDKPVHGVFIREREATEQKEAQVIVQGSFE